ncbi:MAG TPA: NAD(P)/FAD-dependent oxidoreductase [Candidatus Sulfotelmatobacter sp.]|jgi:phytoene dehydrogenase-like protein|nr:NAD(P)/FAD-dependent oxidoreductase [Candidatus Sulfotelmatobacter sp.]
MSSSPDVLIVGAGLAGLCCARELQAKGISFQILEASDGIGGRVRTDKVDGFLLDRGFQVLLTAYPEARRCLDYPRLELKAFLPGVFSWYGGRMNKLVDPWRTPGVWMEALQSQFGTLADKLRIARLRSRLRRTSVQDIFRRPERSTKQALTAEGFSTEMIHHFFRPFLGGILLDGELKSSSRMFDFVLKMMSEGDTSLPARGMGAIPAQLAEEFPGGAVRLNTRVEALHENELTLAGGERLRARATVIAADGPSAAHLVGEVEPASRSVTCFYFSAEEAPVAEPILLLNGDGAGPINNFAVLSRIAPTYAPASKHLVSVSVLGIHQLTDAQLGGFIIAQMKNLFGKAASAWQLLRSYRITHAQPQQYPGALEPPQRPVRIRPGVYACGDHRDNASINGAMASGRRAAEAVLSDLQR